MGNKPHRRGNKNIILIRNDLPHTTTTPPTPPKHEAGWINNLKKSSKITAAFDLKSSLYPALFEKATTYEPPGWRIVVPEGSIKNTDSVYPSLFLDNRSDYIHSLKQYLKNWPTIGLFDCRVYHKISKTKEPQFVSCHSIILRRSPMLSRLLSESKQKHNNQKIVYNITIHKKQIPDQQTLSLFLEYLYTDGISQKVSVRHLLALSQASDIFEVPDLKVSIVNTLQQCCPWSQLLLKKTDEFMDDLHLFQNSEQTDYNSLEKYISSLYNDEKTSDLRFHWFEHNDVVNAHKLILSAGCQYFRNMLSSGMKESTEDLLEIDEFLPQDFYCAMKFIYCRPLDDNIKDPLSLLKLADYYGLDGLQTLCEKIIVDSQEFKETLVEHVWNWFQEAEKMNIPVITAACIHYLNTNFLDPLFIAEQKLNEKLLNKIKSGLKSNVIGGIILKRLNYTSYKMPQQLLIAIISRSGYIGCSLFHKEIGSVARKIDDKDVSTKNFKTQSGEEITVNIIDDNNICRTSGNKPELQKELFQTIDGAILMFDIQIKQTLTELMNYFPTIQTFRENMDPLPIILVGNKIDTVTTTNRTITIKEAVESAQKLDCPYIETSVINKPMLNVEEAFLLLFREIGLRRKLKSKKKSSSQDGHLGKSDDSNRKSNSEEKSEKENRKDKKKSVESVE